MKYRILTVLLLATTTFSQTLPPKGKYKHDKKIEISYDKFQNQTTVRLNSLRPLPIVHPVTLYIIPSFFYPGKVVKTPEYVVFWFQSSSSDWQFLDYRQLLVLADTERLDLGQAARVDSKIDSNRYSRHVSVSELLAVKIPLDTFLKIINSKSVEMKLGRVEFKLADDHLEALRDFASRMY